MKAKIVWSGEVGDYKVEVGRGKEFLYVEIYNYPEIGETSIYEYDGYNSSCYITGTTIDTLSLEGIEFVASTARESISKALLFVTE